MAGEIQNFDERIAELTGPRNSGDEALDKLQPGLSQRVRDALLLQTLVQEAAAKGITYSVTKIQD